MDFVTHAALGATVGQVGFSRSLGRRALGWGALIALLPDLDLLVKVMSNPFSEILYHRGITHSIWFGPIVGPIIGYLLWRYYDKFEDLSTWIGLSIWALLTHAFLDAFTVYGTQLLAPLSKHRFSLSAIPIIDPIYTGILIIGVLLGCMFYRHLRSMITIACITLTLTTSYLFYGMAQNEEARIYARNQLTAEGFPNADVRVYTTMFQIFLRRVVVHLPNESLIGFITTWSPQRIIWYRQPQAPVTIRQAILNHPYGQIYNWFTGDETIIRSHLGDPFQWDLFDSRFGLWGNTLLGVWGRTVTIGANGMVYDDFRGFRLPIDINIQNVKKIWQAAFGKIPIPLS